MVDARYPYEYNGGHIRGAKNLFTREAIQNHFYGANPFFSQNKENQSQDTARRQIIIFHCEFSVERGPAMLKHLRKLDRSKNRYPTLDYPEIYLLKGGYKQFFHDHKEATTGTYAPMLDTKYTQELRHFRRKCKTLPAGKLSLWDNLWLEVCSSSTIHTSLHYSTSSFRAPRLHRFSKFCENLQNLCWFFILCDFWLKKINNKNKKILSLKSFWLIFLVEFVFSSQNIIGPKLILFESK